MSLKPIYRNAFVASVILVLLLLFVLLRIDLVSSPERDDRGRTALSIAAEQGDMAAASALIMDTDTVDQLNDCQWTPLMRAGQKRYADMVELLLTTGADVNARDKGGYTPLMIAAGTENNTEVLQLLLDSGAELDAVDTSLGWTALIWAAREGNLKNAALLLTAGADPTIADADGNTALDWSDKSSFQQLSALLRFEMSQWQPAAKQP